MCCEKDLSYEEAKQLCQMAFDAGVDYHHTCVQFNCNAVAYDWEHWLKRNERLFRPKPTVEDVLADVADRAANLTGSYHEGGMNGDEYMDSMSALVTEYAAKLRLASNEE